MKVTAWNSGKTSQPGAYGIRISRADRDKHFSRSWHNVCIELSDDYTVEVNVSRSFWKDCIELRHRCIGKWIMARGKKAPWGRNPPRFELVPKGAGRFVLR